MESICKIISEHSTSSGGCHSENNNTYEYCSLNGGNVSFVEKKVGCNTCFIGISSGTSFKDIIIGSPFESICKLLIKAVNNRTVERDYFKLYSELLEGTIDENEFENEIEENEDKYVVQNNIDPQIDEIKLALRLSNEISDVKTSEDLSSLFSFNSVELDKRLVEINNYFNE